MLHEWNANADDVMMTWFVLYVNLSDATSGMHDMCMHTWHTYSM